MKQAYFEQNEKMSLWEEFMYNHAYDDDVALIKRTGYNPGAIGLIAIIVMAVIMFL